MSNSNLLEFCGLRDLCVEDRPLRPRLALRADLVQRQYELAVRHSQQERP
jgi:hypothetical protein